MKIKPEPYPFNQEQIPSTGQHILAHQVEDFLVVYQAYNHQIADFAIKHQRLGGEHFSYNRMSWIKPNFLWMMYRCGWASKHNQERVLGLWLHRNHFDEILDEAVYSSFNDEQYPNHDAWKSALEQKDVRLQWDPDHDPYGNKQTRRAIQLGLKGDVLKRFGNEQVVLIEDLTEFVTEQKKLVELKQIDQLQIPIERIYLPQDESIRKKICLS